MEAILSTPLVVSGWPSNMSPDDRKRFMLEQIAEFCQSKKVKVL